MAKKEQTSVVNSAEAENNTLINFLDIWETLGNRIESKDKDATISRCAQLVSSSTALLVYTASLIIEMYYNKVRFILPSSVSAMLNDSNNELSFVSIMQQELTKYRKDKLAKCGGDDELADIIRKWSPVELAKNYLGFIGVIRSGASAADVRLSLKKEIYNTFEKECKELGADSAKNILTVDDLLTRRQVSKLASLGYYVNDALIGQLYEDYQTKHARRLERGNNKKTVRDF